MAKRSSLSTYVALLRGINVGGNAMVSMKELKACFEGLGFADVVTYINSGNIIFKDQRTDIPRLTRLIETGIRAHRSMDIRVLVKTHDDMAAICKKIPSQWVTDQDMRTDVMFLWNEVDTPEMIRTLPSNPDVDRLVYVKGALIWNVTRQDYPKSKVPKMMGSRFYRNMTARNANTTRKLLELMSQRTTEAAQTIEKRKRSEKRRPVR
jgi:uncharacterized protein (DUF1697 family)